MNTVTSILCPCNSQHPYLDCCEPYLKGQRLPPTPEALMRSRYTAYSQANIAYIQQTMRGEALQGFNPEEAKQWATQAHWLGLKVLSAPTPVDPNIGFVEFIATFSLQNRPQTIHERSEFHRIDSQWFYIRGVTPKISRNDACPCHSGKKYKHCCRNSR